MRSCRVGVVGCGPRGRAYAAVLAALDCASVAQCVDEDPHAARACAAAVGGQAAAAWDANLLDALVVAGPAGGHGRAALAAVRAGLPVLVDPPLAVGVAEARRAARAAREAGAHLHTAFGWRFEPLVQLLRQVMPSPAFAHAAVAVGCGPPVPTPTGPGQADARLWGAPLHALDLLAHLFGALPDEIVADGDPAAGAPLAAELYFDQVRHASVSVVPGGSGGELGPVVLDLTDGAARARVWADWTEAEIRALDGRALELPERPGVHAAPHGAAVRLRTPRGDHALRAPLRALLDAAAQAAPPGPEPAADGVRAAVLMQTMLRAAASGRRQPLHAP